MCSHQGYITSSRLTHISAISGATRYLEIGVNKGRTFLNMELPIVDAVDPHFKFRTDRFLREGRKFYEMTSDDFFRSRDQGVVYDLIFLDGLHTFEQCFRDFCATMAFSHDRTVWLIDDTCPNDAFSIRRSSIETRRLREDHGLESQAWHGDVFKTLFAIHDFFPTFDYRTVVGKGNPQSIILRKPRKKFSPVWNNLERISRSDYVDFLNNKPILNESSEDDAFKWLGEALAPKPH